MHKFQNGFPTSKFIFISESFEGRSRAPEAEVSNEAITPVDYSLSDAETTRFDRESSARQAQSAEFDKHHAEEFSGFEANYGAELDAAYAPEEVDQEEAVGNLAPDIEPVAEALVENPDQTRITTPPVETMEDRDSQERFDRQKQEIDSSFLGGLIDDFSDYTTGQVIEHEDDDWKITSVGKFLGNTATSVLSGIGYAGEGLVKGVGSFLEGGWNLVSNFDETTTRWGNAMKGWAESASWEGTKEFFGNWWKDTVAVWENSPAEGKIGMVVVTAIDALGGKGAGRLAKLEEIMRKAGDLVPFGSPEFVRRTEVLRNHLDEVSPGNIRRIEEETIRDGVDRGWFTEAEFKEVLEQEHRQLLERFERGEVRLTNNFEEDKLDDIFGSGGIKTKYELDDPGWVMVGKYNERLKRAKIETDMKVEGLNPKYAGFDGGTDKWGEFEMVLDPRALQDRLSFTHLDSFNAGVGRNNPSMGQLNMEGALRSRAILNAERRLLEKKYEKVINIDERNERIEREWESKYKQPDNVYTETQVLGPMRLGHEIKEIIVPKAFRADVEEKLKKYPEYRRFITYK